MAIEQSSIDPNFQANLELLRNAPTPPVQGDFDLSSYDFSSYPFDADSLLQNNQTIVFQQQYGTEPTLASGQQLYSAESFITQSAPGSSFQYFAAPPSRAYIDQTVDESGRQSVVSKMSERKEKCMSRNAIAARENREKKKGELTTLKKRVDQLEQENAVFKKKNHELKEAYKDSQERLKYYESVMSNLPSIVEIIEHMKSLPNKEESAKKIKKKLNTLNLTSNHGNLGICFHVKTNQEMSLRFCETCSNGGTSKKKHVET